MLQDRSIPYRWNFHFQLQIKKDVSWLNLRDPSDIPAIQSALGLPNLPSIIWPQTYTPFRRAERRGADTMTDTMTHRKSESSRNHRPVATATVTVATV